MGRDRLGALSSDPVAPKIKRGEALEMGRDRFGALSADAVAPKIERGEAG